MAENVGDVLFLIWLSLSFSWTAPTIISVVLDNALSWDAAMLEMKSNALEADSTKASIDLRVSLFSLLALPLFGKAFLRMLTRSSWTDFALSMERFSSQMVGAILAM